MSIVTNGLIKSASITPVALQYNLQLYMLVRVGNTSELKYMPILRDDVKGQKNDMLDNQGLLNLENTADVYAKLVDFGERAEAAGDISLSVPITDANAPLFIVRQNSFTTTGSNDTDTTESSASGDPFVCPIFKVASK